MFSIKVFVNFVSIIFGQTNFVNFLCQQFSKKDCPKIANIFKKFWTICKKFETKKNFEQFFWTKFFFQNYSLFSKKFFFANLVSSFLLISTCESTMTFTRKTFDFEKGSSLSVIEIIPFCFTFSQLIYGIYILPLFSRFCYNKFWHTFFSIFLIGVKNNNFDVKKAKYWCKKTNCLCTIIGLKMEQIWIKKILCVKIIGVKMQKFWCKIKLV